MKEQRFSISGIMYLLVFVAGWSVYSACNNNTDNEPCQANTTRTCKCIGARVNGERQCILGEQTCKTDGTGYIPCRCGSTGTPATGAGSGSGSGTSSNTNTNTNTNANANANATGPIVSCDGDPHPPKPAAPTFTALEADGYKTVSDVVSHSMVGQDIEDIKTLLATSPKDYAGAEKIYKDGKNSSKGTSFRTIASFSQTAANFDTYAPDAVKFFGGAKFIDNLVYVGAIEGGGAFAQATDGVRAATIVHGILALMTYWVRLEFAKALEKVKANNYEKSEGAPHNWDEGFAYYWGNKGKGSLYAFAAGLSEKYKLAESINREFMEQMVAGLAKQTAATPSSPEAEIKNATLQLRRLMLLGILDAASQIDANSDVAAKQVAQAVGFALWHGVGDFVATAGKDVETAFKDVLTGQPKDKSADTLKAVIKKSLSTWGFKEVDFGTALP